MKHKFNIDSVNKWLSAIQSIVVIAGIIGILIAWSQYQQTEKGTSFQLVTQLEDQINSKPRYASLEHVIENGNQTTPILRVANGGNQGDYSVETIYGYLNIYDSIASLVKEGLIAERDAYDNFGNNFEEIWCNDDIQGVVTRAQQQDSSTTVNSDPYFGDFEKLAKTYLQKDKENCKQVYSN